MLTPLCIRVKATLTQVCRVSGRQIAPPPKLFRPALRMSGDWLSGCECYLSARLPRYGVLNPPPEEENVLVRLALLPGLFLAALLAISWHGIAPPPAQAAE